MAACLGYCRLRLQLVQLQRVSPRLSHKPNVFAQDTTFGQSFTFAVFTPNSRARRRISGVADVKRRFQRTQICFPLLQQVPLV